MASQITGVSIVCFNVCSGVDQRKHQSAASLAFVRGIHRWPVDSPHKGLVTRNVSIWWRHRISIGHKWKILNSHNTSHTLRASCGTFIESASLGWITRYSRMNCMCACVYVCVCDLQIVFFHIEFLFADHEDGHRVIEAQDDVSFVSGLVFKQRNNRYYRKHENHFSSEMWHSLNLSICHWAFIRRKEMWGLNYRMFYQWNSM